MSKWHQTHPIALVAIWLVTMLPRGSVSASHFSWLGHSECPDGAAACETLIPAGFTALGQFEVAHYRILDEAAPEWRTEPRDEPLLSRDGTVITHVGRKFKAQLEREGSARLRDGRIINAEERVRGRWRYLVIQDAPFGIGAPGYKLMPYRTLSVDAKRIPLGTVLYVPALVGVALPNGDIHDGFVFAHDMNDNKTVHNTIHLFLGFNASTTLSLKPGMAKRLVRVYQADRDTAAVLNRRFKAQFDWSG